MTRRKDGGHKPPLLSEEDVEAFRAAVRDTRPLPDPGRISFRRPAPPPVPAQTLRDEQAVLADSLSDHVPGLEDIETGEELSFLREGLARQVLRKLKRGEWVIEAELDLHGHTVDEARATLAEFLNDCRKRGLRCLRIIHGKGLRSPGKEPVLKNKVRVWLMQRDEVLAFCQARPVDGGGGAALVLLRSKP
jgi:DNA-nicking Smr family endonuclease